MPSAIDTFQFFEFCDTSVCSWMGEGKYGGCLQTDIHQLTFNYFDSNGMLDLRCSHVDVIYVDNTPLRCKDVDLFFLTQRPLTVYLNGDMCHVSSSRSTRPTASIRSTKHPTTHTATSGTTRATSSSILNEFSEHVSSSRSARPTASIRSTKHPTTHTATSGTTRATSSSILNEFSEHVSSSRSTRPTASIRSTKHPTTHTATSGTTRATSSSILNEISEIVGFDNGANEGDIHNEEMGTFTTIVLISSW
ncbi:uncharacterized protein LOC133171708 isoform X2 [Saccostrea echinata]|uniref:uncharacterized protein LOC133171708 isoform X2 n=1 Tax=Saccostrea echinata TaxID=191078 RepID=UPI002A81E185|nr:uncharacterized protein LOC133171708 isoform X2 [Saccostrea echinata]